MSNLDPKADRVALHVNGHFLAEAQESSFDAFEYALRGVALSDSPVLIRASDRHLRDLVERLHRLGRRKQQPVHQCRHPEEAQKLFRVVLESDDHESGDALGTWALHGRRGLAPGDVGEPAPSA